MVTTIIQVADIHIRNLKRLDELKDALDVFIKKCKKIIKEKTPEAVRICVCGDIFENHITISNEALACCSYFFRELNKLGCKVIVFAGNHDYSTGAAQRLDSLSPIFSLGKYENLFYLDSELGYESGCLVDNNIVWCLYSTFEGFANPPIEDFKENHPEKTFVGLIHGEVNGATNFFGMEMTHGLDPGSFSQLDFVLAGHIHKFQEIKKNGVPVVYCSSLIQKDFGETVTGHGFVVWDVPSKSYEFVKIPNSDYGLYKFTVNGLQDLEDDKEELTNL